MPPAGNDHEQHHQGQCCGERAGHHVIKPCTGTRQNAEEQGNESDEQNRKAAEENKWALGFERHQFIVK